MGPPPAAASRPLFISFEGGEGAGKSTQIRLLSEALASSDQPHIVTREPGGSPGAEALRLLLLSPEQDWAPDADTLLHFAARAEHIAKTIAPALQAGRHVLCDRFYDSTRAYQGYGQNADRQMIETLIGLLPLKPDLTLILDVPGDEARARLARRDTTADRYERMGAAFHARVAEGFRAIAAAEPARCLLLDGAPDAATVAAAVLAAVQARLASPHLSLPRSA